MPARLFRRATASFPAPGTVLLLLAGLASAASAQGETGRVDGLARIAETGAPIPFALVRLLPADSQAAAPRQGITSADGHFRFAAVVPGEYRVQLLRIGYQPVLSPVLQVRPGEALQHELRAPTQPIQLPAVLVRGGGRCLQGAELADEPQLSTLWTEARKGLELRHAFELRYRFTRIWRKQYDVKLALRPDRRTIEMDTLFSEPDSVPARERRRRSRSWAERNDGWTNLRLADERELLDEAFLGDHCLESSVVDTETALGLRFRPVQLREGAFDLRGTVWLDPATYLIQRLELEYLDGSSSLGTIGVEYADVAVDGSALRLPARGSASLGATRVAFSFSYQEFREIRPE